MGVIVAIDDYAERRVYTVDDSSGVNIECVLMLRTDKRAAKKDSSILGPRPPIPSEFSHLAVGCVVDVKGTITHYHQSRGLKIARAQLLPSTESELLLWEKRRAFRVTVLDQPWVLPESEILRCRREAERADAELAASKRKGRKRSKPEIEADPFKIIKEKAPTKRVRQAEEGVASRPISSKVPAKEVSCEAKAMKRGGKTPDPLEEAVTTDPYSLMGKTNAPKTRTAKPQIPSTRDSNADELRGKLDRFAIRSRASVPPPARPPPKLDASPRGTVGRSQRQPSTRPQEEHADEADESLLARGRRAGDDPPPAPSLRSGKFQKSMTADPFKITKPTSSALPTKLVDPGSRRAGSVVDDRFSIKNGSPLKKRSANVQDGLSTRQLLHKIGSDPFSISNSKSRRVSKG